jgi:hypothetical protein
MFFINVPIGIVLVLGWVPSQDQKASRPASDCVDAVGRSSSSARS